VVARAVARRDCPGRCSLGHCGVIPLRPMNIGNLVGVASDEIALVVNLDGRNRSEQDGNLLQEIRNWVKLVP
jgi:hypothetical protein